MSDSIDLSEMQRQLNDLTLSWKKERTIEATSEKNRIKVERKIVDIISLTNPNLMSYNTINIDNGVYIFLKKKREWLDDLSCDICNNILDALNEIGESNFTLELCFDADISTVNHSKYLEMINDYSLDEKKEVDDE